VCGAEKLNFVKANVLKTVTDQPMTIVGQELAWRARPSEHSQIELPSQVRVTRWQSHERQTQEVCADTPSGFHVVKIVLKNMNIRLSLAGRTVQDGIATPGMFHVTPPDVQARCLFRGSYDVLHLQVPNGLIAECAQEVADQQETDLCSQVGLVKDPMIERLGLALLAADQIGGPLGYQYADCISTAVTVRLLATAGANSERPKVTELARWRLRRAIDYLEAHLAEPISTSDVAATVGLKRMHFAAQFRAATGLRPHEYLLRRRIERAQELLIRTSKSVVEVALSVGFHTQSHFTIVFNRFVGQPPHAWRQSNLRETSIV
jgi:AraC-like DNA-binding protein